MRKFQPTRWQCPYCSSYTILRAEDVSEYEGRLRGVTEERVEFELRGVVCQNPDCDKLSVHISIKDVTPRVDMVIRGGGSQSTVVHRQRKERQNVDIDIQLLPLSKATTLPEYVPEAIRKDYEEACLILHLSPKASATLSRRCIQTIIRDFWGIKGERTLEKEIDALEDVQGIDPKLIEAFDHLRNIGNIGAHMEKDVNLIIDVDPGEADMLIKFIEDVLDLTYIQRDMREKRYENLKKISESKKEMKRKDVDDIT